MADISTKRRTFEDGSDLDAALNPARNYPRKRVAVACEVCRLRKTKCDAKRPCSFCTESGIQCVYRPGQNNYASDKPNSAADILTRIEERLARLEETLRPGASDSASTPGSHRRTSMETAISSRPRPADENRKFFQQIVSEPRYDFSFRQTAGEAVTARPSIVSFHSPYFLQFESWDDTEVFYDDELEQEERLFEAMEAGNRQGLDMTARTVWQLQQSFVMTFLQWMPLIESQALSHHVELAQSGNFSRRSASDCLVMFALAIGTIDRAPPNSTARSGPILGLDYFNAGRQILATINRRSRRSVTLLQCRILQACYLQLIMRPLQAWDVVMEIARDCMHILSSGTLKRMETIERENFHRVFWICSVILHELEAVLKLHPIGLRQFHEVVPLPLTDADDEGYYYFFAQASLRKILTETLDVVGYRVGQVIYAPLVAQELCKQVDDWYKHLPSHVRFPATTVPIFDLRKAFLRLQYLALHAVIFWPSVLQLLESSATVGPDSNGNILDRKKAQREARECIENITFVCEVAGELLMQRHLGLQFVIWASYASLSMLIICYRSPALSYIPQTQDDRAIRSAFRALQQWEDEPVVSRAVARTRGHLARAGISVDDDIEHLKVPTPGS